MEINKVIDLLGDKIFTVTFIKKDNSIRIMNARRGVKKGVKGVGLAYNPTEKDLITVFDMQKEAFRMINAKTILEIKADKKAVLDELNAELLNQVILKTKTTIKTNKDYQNKVSSKLLQGL